MKFAICNETYEGWEFARVCDHVASCGYDALELAPFTFSADPRELTEDDALRAGETARRAGLEIAGLHWLLVKPPGMHLTTPDPAVRRRTAEFVQHLVRWCAAAGGKVLVWGSPAQRSLADGQDPAEALDNACEVLREVCATAESHGVTLALEPLDPGQTDFLTCAAEARELIAAVGSKACRLHLDVNAMSKGEARPIPEVIREHREFLAHFHANDPNLRGPGFGEVDYSPIAAALREIDYRGYVSVEVFDYRPDPETIAAESIGYLRRHFGAVRE